MRCAILAAEKPAQRLADRLARQVPDRPFPRLRGGGPRRGLPGCAVPRCRRRCGRPARAAGRRGGRPVLPARHASPASPQPFKPESVVSRTNSERTGCAMPVQPISTRWNSRSLIFMSEFSPFWNSRNGWGRRKRDPLLGRCPRLDRGGEPLLEQGDALLDDVFRALAPAVTSTVSLPRNQARSMSAGPSIRCEADAAVPGHFGQPAAVGAVPAADHQDHVGRLRERSDRLLPVLRGVADVVLVRRGDLGKPLPQPLDRPCGIVQRKRGLGEIGQLFRVGDLQPIDVRRGFRPTASPGGPRPSPPPPRRVRRGRSRRSCTPPRRSGSPRGGPWSPRGRWRRWCAARAGRPRRRTSGETPWAE